MGISICSLIKFKEKPDPHYMTKEINLINNKLDYLYSTARNLSIRIDKKN